MGEMWGEGAEGSLGKDSHPHSVPRQILLSFHISKHISFLRIQGARVGRAVWPRRTQSRTPPPRGTLPSPRVGILHCD